MVTDMKPELLAAAFLLRRTHGVKFAAALLEEHGVPRDCALRLLADRPMETSWCSNDTVFSSYEMPSNNRLE